MSDHNFSRLCRQCYYPRGQVPDLTPQEVDKQDMTTDATDFTVDHLAETHEVLNQSRPLVNYNSYSGDTALKEGVQRYAAAWATDRLAQHGERCGSAEVINWGFLANEFRPQFHSHDRQGFRVDEVRYHDAYHQLMRLGLEAGLHSDPWTCPRRAHMLPGRPGTTCRRRSNPVTVAR